MNRRLPVLASLLGSLVLPGCLGNPDRIETFDYVDVVERVEISTGSGDIEIHVDPGAVETSVEARVYGDATRTIASLEGGALVLRHHCPKRLRQCGVDWIVTIPEAEAGRIYDLSSGSGDIGVADGAGVFVAHTGSGDIALHDVFATDVELETGSGDIGARLEGAPASVLAKTGSGDIGFALPSGGYQIDIDTGSGDVSTRGVSNDSAAEGVLELRTGSGDVSVRGR
ncbi:MAG: DUF4097 family beta strand repeat-containing protein [Nannocystales bacterium]